MYKHYVNTKDNNYGVFYEVSNPSSIKLIVNSNPSTRKVFKTINYEGDNGWNASLNLTAADGDDATKGIFGDDTEDYVTAQVGYDGDSFGGTITYSDRLQQLKFLTWMDS